MNSEDLLFMCLWGFNMENMKISVVIHKQLPARDILNETLWRTNYNYFNEGKRKNGIYFYSYNNSTIPYYIGMSAANILGRVWDELNDYRNGEYYLPKEPDKLSTLECFKSGSSPESFFIPGDFDKDDKYFQDILNTMLDNTKIIFSYLEMNPQVDDEKMRYVFYNIEALFQKNIVAAKKLHPKWIGDEGKGYSSKQQYNYIVDIVYEDPNLENILDTELLLGKKKLR